MRAIPLLTEGLPDCSCDLHSLSILQNDCIFLPRKRDVRTQGSALAADQMTRGAEVIQCKDRNTSKVYRIHMKVSLRDLPSNYIISSFKAT